MIFNVNHNVRVKLNQRGLDILKAEHDDLRESFPKLGPWKPPTVDSEGYSTFQLWALMQTFGPHVGLGMQVPFDTEILIDK